MPSPPTRAELAVQAVVALRRLADAVASELDESWPDEAPLPGELNIRGSVTAAATTLEGALRKRLQANRPRSGTFVSGAVFCFLCRSAGCPHAAPPTATSVFVGYKPVGKPDWAEFVSVCLSMGGDKADGLFRASSAPNHGGRGATGSRSPERDAIVALAFAPDDLHYRLLPDFDDGGAVARVMGQVSAGLIPRDLALERHDVDRVAVSVQVVDLPRSARYDGTLRLNLIGITMDAIVDACGDDRAETPDPSAGRGPAELLRRLLRGVREELQALDRRRALTHRGANGRSGSDEPFSLESELASLMNRTALDLERIFRGLDRRTRHAQQRHEGGERPTAHALGDAREAPAERLFKDTESNAVVVVGRRGRAHLFARDGRLVTSLVLGAGELERKLERRRWLPLPNLDVTRFREALAKVAPV